MNFYIEKNYMHYQEISQTLIKKAKESVKNSKFFSYMKFNTIVDIIYKEKGPHIGPFLDLSNYI